MDNLAANIKVAILVLGGLGALLLLILSLRVSVQITHPGNPRRRHAPVDREPEPTPAPPPKCAVGNPPATATTQEAIRFLVDDAVERLRKEEGEREVRVLRIQPGDVMIVRVHEDITDAEVAFLKEQMTKLFPGHKCMVFVEGMELSVAREKASEATDG